MRWLTRQLQQHAGGAFRFTEGFSYNYLSHDFIHSDVLVCREGIESIDFQVQGSVKLLFHTHAWCGSITIYVNDNEYYQSLYSIEHGLLTVPINIENSKSAHIVIRTGAKPDADAKGNEVWFVALEIDHEQSWQVVSTPVSSFCTLTHGEVGTFLTLTSDAVIGASITQTGVWAPKDVSYFRSILRPGMTALDIGANLGHHTVLYSSIVGREGRVIAFEPQSTVFRLLAANTVMNGCQNTDIVQSCVGESEGFVHLFPINYAESFNFGALGVDPDPEARGALKGERCRVASLDSLLSELAHPPSRCDFIKIDVQSFELFVLRGAEATISRFKPTLFLEVAPFWMSKMYDYREIYKFLWNLGYKIDHPSDSSVPAGEIKVWSGAKGEEWDVIATPTVTNS